MKAGTLSAKLLRQGISLQQISSSLETTAQRSELTTMPDVKPKLQSLNSLSINQLFIHEGLILIKLNQPVATEETLYQLIETKSIAYLHSGKWLGLTNPVAISMKPDTMVEPLSYGRIL